MFVKDYNIIPIGDHCSSANILKDLELRKCSYPFDWVAMNYPHKNTNFHYIINLLWNMKTENIETITKDFIGDAFVDEIYLNSKTNIWFPHDSGDFDENYSKYLRRFQRLYLDLTSKKNIFLLITRNHAISEKHFYIMMNVLTSYNNENKVIFISGRQHPYLSNIDNSIIAKYKENVVFKHIFFNFKIGFTYDDEFRENCKEYLREFLIRFDM